MATMQRKTLVNTGSQGKPEFGHSQTREDLSQKDKKALARTLGPFDFQMPLSKIHETLVKNHRFHKTKPPESEEDSLRVISESGFSGYMTKTMLHQVCNSI